MSVYLRTLKNHTPEYTKFMYMLPVAMAWSSSDGNAVSYVLLVLCITTFSYNRANGPESEMMHVLSSSSDGGIRDEVCRLRLHLVSTAMLSQ